MFHHHHGLSVKQSRSMPCYHHSLHIVSMIFIFLNADAGGKKAKINLFDLHRQQQKKLKEIKWTKVKWPYKIQETNYSDICYFPSKTSPHFSSGSYRYKSFTAQLLAPFHQWKISQFTQWILYPMQPFKSTLQHPNFPPRPKGGDQHLSLQFLALWLPFTFQAFLTFVLTLKKLG